MVNLSQFEVNILQSMIKFEQQIIFKNLENNDHRWPGIAEYAF